MEEKKYLTIINNNGEEQKLEILSIFNWSKTKKYYVIYTDNTKDGELLNVYASIYNPKDESLEDINTSLEWDEVERRLKELSKV